MATITLNIPDAALPRVVPALSFVVDPTQPPSNALAKAGLIQLAKEQIRQFEIMTAVENIDIT